MGSDGLGDERPEQGEIEDSGEFGPESGGAGGGHDGILECEAVGMTGGDLDGEGRTGGRVFGFGG